MPGFAAGPHFEQRKRPSGFGGMGRKLYSKTQYGQRKIPLAILGPFVLSPSAFTPSPRAFEVFIAPGSGRPVHLRALPTGAFEIWLFGNCGVATLQAQEPSFRARQHWLEIPTQHAIHRTIWSSISAFRSLAPRGEPRATLASFNLIFYPYSG